MSAEVLCEVQVRSHWRQYSPSSLHYHCSLSSFTSFWLSHVKVGTVVWRTLLLYISLNSFCTAAFIAHAITDADSTAAPI